MAEARRNLNDQIPTRIVLHVHEKFPSHFYHRNFEFIEQVINEVKSFMDTKGIVGVNPAVVVPEGFISYLALCAEHQRANAHLFVGRQDRYDNLMGCQIIGQQVKIKKVDRFIHVKWSYDYYDTTIAFGVDPDLEDWQARACFDDGSNPELTIGISDDRLYR